MSAPTETRGRWAVRTARMASDNLVLAVTFVVFFLMSSGYFMYSAVASLHETGLGASTAEYIAAFIGAGMAGALLFALLLGIGMFMVRMHRQAVLGNSLQVEYSDHAWLRDWVNTVAADLDMPKVEVFVTQNPVMNAYAMGFARPYIIVLNSGSIRYLSKEELKVIVLHEMAHVKYKHTDALVYLSPFLSLPVINVFGAWVAGFWQRRTELTCDRLALLYCGDGELVKRSLIAIHVGPDVADSMNDTARQWLQYNAERPMNRLAQTLSSHPFLVRRLSHIDRWQAIAQPVAQSESAVEKPAAR